MIKRIKYIKGFGIFKDFKWVGNIQDFREKNIIYGWNYSGKTTLSRLFTFIKDGKVDPNCTGLDFKFIYGEDNKEITQNNLDKQALSFQVFNSDYIRKNLKWDSKESLEPISFDVGENVAIREEIKKNQERIDLILGTGGSKGKMDFFKKAIEKFLEFDNSKIPQEAKRIKNDIFNSLIEFTKKHFDAIKGKLGQDYEKQIVTDPKKLLEIKRKALAVNDKGIIGSVSLIPAFKKLKENVSQILESEPAESDVIEILENNPELYKWSKEGLKFHSPKTLKVCSFCGNSIQHDRFDKLKNYFSNEASSLRGLIYACRLSIQEEISKIKIFKLNISKNDFTDSCKDEFQILLDLFQEIKIDYVRCLNELEEELNRKEHGNIFIKLELINIEQTTSQNLEEWTLSVQKLIDTHNNIVNNFDSQQKEARNSLKNHYVASFLKKEKYYDLKHDHDYAIECLRRYQCLADKLNLKNSQLNAQLKSILAGKEELNKFIKAFLNNDDVKIDVTEDDKFILKRGKDYALNLSEGEKTAIAFAYFLVVLESLHKEHKLTETIIFIDDPISSLDANHIAQIYSLLNSFFFRKGVDLAHPDKITNCFKQLFISTHNFDFFSFLKDSGQINRKKKEGQVIYPTCEYYLIKRIEKDSSIILPLPKSIKTYKSEYIYLFEIIYKYYINGCLESDDEFLLMPNALRRFLEIYTLMKLPHLKDEFENRVNELMGDINQLKILNHFSHFTSFEKLTKYDDLIMNLPAATEELFQLLSKDEPHFSSLKRAINVN